MPRVTVSMDVLAPIDEVWSAVKDIEAYPNFMENVRHVEITDEYGDARDSNWSTLLKGSVLEWKELERIDDESMTITFNQLDGDLDKFDGFWSLTPGDNGSVNVTLDVEFEIGIPLLAEMLNPVAARALRENSQTMLREIECRVADR